MIYTIDFNVLYPLVDEEISRVAAQSYGEGGSFYDGIVLHANDGNEVLRLENDAINTLVKRTHDIVTILANDTAGRPRLEFTVPDLDISTEGLIEEEINRFIVLNTCAAWFQSRAANKVEEFALRSQTALDKAISMLYTRKKPSRT